MSEFINHGWAWYLNNYGVECWKSHDDDDDDDNDDDLSIIRVLLTSFPTPLLPAQAGGDLCLPYMALHFAKVLTTSHLCLKLLILPFNVHTVPVFPQFGLLWTSLALLHAFFSKEKDFMPSFVHQNSPSPTVPNFTVVTNHRPFTFLGVFWWVFISLYSLCKNLVFQQKN